MFKGFDSVLGTLCVEHYRNREIEFFAHFLYHIELFEMLRMSAVGEVEPRNVETRLAHFGEYFRVAAGRTYCAYYLCLSHYIPSFPLYNHIYYIISCLRVQYSKVKKQATFEIYIILISLKKPYIPSAEKLQIKSSGFLKKDLIF